VAGSRGTGCGEPGNRSRLTGESATESQIEASFPRPLRGARPGGPPFLFSEAFSLGRWHRKKKAQGDVFGMMPHPERVFYRYQHPDWTRKGGPNGPGDGRAIFESVLDYICKKF
jgi:hypothetical protein